MAVETTLKRWGNSMAVIVPMQLVQQKNLKENEKVVIEVAKKADLSHIFGTLKLERKLNGQEIKDLARRGWESEHDRRENEKWKKQQMKKE